MTFKIVSLHMQNVTSTVYKQGHSQTLPDGRAHRFSKGNIVIVIYWYAGSHVYLLKVAVCMKMHSTTKLA